MISSEALNNLTDEEFSLLEYIITGLNNNSNIVFNINTLKSYKYSKLAEKIFNARHKLNKEKKEGISLYNSLCIKFNIQEYKE